jgi:hypothetical protein
MDPYSGDKLPWKASSRSQRVRLGMYLSTRQYSSWKPIINLSHDTRSIYLGSNMIESIVGELVEPSRSRNGGFASLESGQFWITIISLILLVWLAIKSWRGYNQIPKYTIRMLAKSFTSLSSINLAWWCCPTVVHEILILHETNNLKISDALLFVRISFCIGDSMHLHWQEVFTKYKHIQKYHQVILTCIAYFQRRYLVR